MSVLIPVSWGELFDKISILSIKCKRIKAQGKLKNVHHELNLLTKISEAKTLKSEELDLLCNQLLEVNTSLWDIEDEIRLCEKSNEFGPRFIELARSVYRRNDKRAALKGEINTLLGSEVVEEKSYQDY